MRRSEPQFAGFGQPRVAMRTDAEFRTEDGVTLRAGTIGRIAAGGHGRRSSWRTASVKEMYLDRLAEAFAAAGLAAVVFDNRSFGASEGEPRQELDR
jgi:uncharacterized protein